MVEHMSQVNQAAACLARWVHACVRYGVVKDSMRPMQKEVEDANRRIVRLRARLEQLGAPPSPASAAAALEPSAAHLSLAECTSAFLLFMLSFYSDAYLTSGSATEQLARSQQLLAEGVLAATLTAARV
jgi:hypothetical protein